MPGVLLIEDNVALAKALRMLLHAAGYDPVLLAHSGGLGVLLAQQEHEALDMVVLDIGLPDRSGHAVARQLRWDTRTSHLPVLFLTGTHQTDTDRTLSAEVGAVGFMLKPYDSDRLLDVIREAIASAAEG